MSLADQIREAYLSHVSTPDVTRGPLNDDSVIAAAEAKLDPNGRRDAATQVEPPATEPKPAKDRAAAVEEYAAVLQKHYGDRLHEVPSMQWVGELSNAKFELVMDALAELNARNETQPAGAVRAGDDDLDLDDEYDAFEWDEEEVE